ncbi:MAG: hypothetical protein WC519_02090 [Parcubacteria group bacterium]|jgi:DNA polymerase III delta prime subunit
MLIGRESEREIIERLKKKNLLAGSFLFFGEPQIGKFAFADELTREFEENPAVPEERLIIRTSDKIGINEIRDAKNFLRKRPIMSKFRVIIIADADKMTPEAQNAALKVVEEPPSHALIIFVASGAENLLPTLVSRLRKLYFPRVKESKIASWLTEQGVSEEKAAIIARTSFGRPGLALEILEDQMKKSSKEMEIPQKFASAEDFEKYMRTRLARLYFGKEKNYAILKEALYRTAASLRFNTNKKLQLLGISWTR